MPSLKTFSLFESKLNTINIESFPYHLTSQGASIIIEQEGKRYSISSEAEIMVNNQKCHRSPIHSSDLIRSIDDFIIFYEDNSYIRTSTLIGKIRLHGNRYHIFKLPKKSSQRPFGEIHTYLSKHTDAENVYIDVSAIQYMDSDAIGEMIELIKSMKRQKRMLHFYHPSYKFLTYLKLANIEKIVSLASTPDPAIEAFITERESGLSRGSSASRYILTDNRYHYFIDAETVISVGRLNNTCDICLEDERVSRIHALLLNSNHFPFIIDCRSTNHTFVNGWQLSPYRLTSLKVNDIIAFGQKTHYKVKQI